MLLRLTAIRGGCVGRAYRLSRFPVISIEDELKMASKIEVTAKMADRLEYVLPIQGQTEA
jgi:hypothetical protein